MVTLRRLAQRQGLKEPVASPCEDCSGQESGFVLLSVLFLVALIVLTLAVAAPRVADDIRRDRESEFYHRGMQYQRAIKLYVRKTGHYPTSIEQLENTNEIRFLRRRYKDPMTGKDEWHLIHLGEAKVPPMGLFGQPLSAGVPAAAVGSSIGDSSKLTSGIGGDSTVGVSTGDGSAALPGGVAGGTLGTPGAVPTDGPAPGPTDSSAPGGGSTGFIVGVTSNNTRESIRTYKNQTHYNQWEFVYNPAEDKAGAGLAPAPTGGTGTSSTSGTGSDSNTPAPGRGFTPPPDTPTSPPGSTGP